MTQPSTRILIIGAGILSDCLKREASQSPPRPPDRVPLSLTVLGQACIERRREAWHPQGPVHPQNCREERDRIPRPYSDG